MGWEVRVPGGVAFAAVRTARGTTLVSSLDQVTEYDGAGKVVWQFATRDVASPAIHNLTGLHLLADGTVVAGCYRAYDKGQGCGLLAISRDKRVLWNYTNPTGDGTMMPVELLDAAGRAFPGDCRR